eukprot:447580-Prymnesium_polylepis.2
MVIHHKHEHAKHPARRPHPRSGPCMCPGAGGARGILRAASLSPRAHAIDTSLAQTLSLHHQAQWGKRYSNASFTVTVQVTRDARRQYMKRPRIDGSGARDRRRTGRSTRSGRSRSAARLCVFADPWRATARAPLADAPLRRCVRVR